MKCYGKVWRNNKYLYIEDLKIVIIDYLFLFKHSY